MNRGLSLVVVVAATALLAVGGAAGMPRVSTPLPPLSSFALAPSDFKPGAVVASQRTTSSGDRTLFLRVFKPGVAIGGSSLLTALSVTILDPDAASAGGDFVDFRDSARTKAGRAAIGKEWSDEFVRGYRLRSHDTANVTIEQTVVGAPVPVGRNAVRLSTTVKTSIGTINVAMGVVQADRVLEIVELASMDGRVSAADAVRAVTDVQTHLKAGFAVAGAAAPTVAGTALQGQTLSVDEGSWTGAPSAFTYAWSRCDSTGANCLPVDGATGKTYAVTAADAGFTLQAAVTAANSVSSGHAASAVTAVVS